MPTETVVGAQAERLRFTELVDQLADAEAHLRPQVGSLRAEIELRLARLEKLFPDGPKIKDLRERLTSFLLSYHTASGVDHPGQKEHRAAVRQRDRDQQAIREWCVSMEEVVRSRGDRRIIEGRPETPATREHD